MSPSVEGDAALHQTPTAGSWIDPFAKTGALLYVTGGTDVDIFTWPKLQHAGLLTGFQQTSAACVDAGGNVWIGDAYAKKMYEFPHALRRQSRRSTFTLEKFHDELLSRGDPPLPLLRPLILGSSDDGKPL